MREFARILCPVDFSESTAAGLRPATALARAFDAELFLLHVIEFPHESVALERMYLEVEDAAGERLTALAGTLDPAPRRAHEVVLRGAPYDRITRFAAEQSVDLIVMPTHRHAALDRLLFGSVAERVLRIAECAVLMVPPTDQGSFRLDRLLFATDFSATADRAQPYAQAVARGLDAEMTVLHIATLAGREEPGEGWRFPVLPPDVERAELDSADRNVASRVARAERSGVRATGLVLKGSPPAMEISQHAQEIGAGVILVASHGHSAVARALLGSTSEKLARISPVPVMVVRPRDNG
jgi:nucleotide-binding universal stress UspA family protein